MVNEHPAAVHPGLTDMKRHVRIGTCHPALKRTVIHMVILHQVERRFARMDLVVNGVVAAAAGGLLAVIVWLIAHGATRVMHKEE